MSLANPLTFHLYVIGGSAAYGEPLGYGEPQGTLINIGTLTRYFLGGRLLNRNIQVINLAFSGQDSKGDLDALRQLIKQEKHPERALVLIYSGNNEFLPYFEADSPRKLYDRPLVSPQVRQKIVKRYRHNVESMILALKRADIPMIVSTMAANFKDWDPNRSVLINRKNSDMVETFFHSAEQYSAQCKQTAALEKYLALLKLEPNFSLVLQRVGAIYLQRQDYQKAIRYFQAAIDYDGFPQRATTDQNQALKDLTAKYGVRLTDAQDVLERNSPGGIIGYELMWDNFHPHIDGFILIAQDMAKQAALIYGVPQQLAPPARESVDRYFGLTPELYVQALTSRAQYCYNSASLTWNPTFRLKRADYYLKKAEAIKPRDTEVLCGLAALNILRNEPVAAINYFRRAFLIDSETTKKRANLVGMKTNAWAQFNTLPQLLKGYPALEIKKTMALSHMLRNDYTQARKTLTEAFLLAPQDPEVWRFYRELDFPEQASFIDSEQDLQWRIRTLAPIIPFQDIIPYISTDIGCISKGTGLDWELTEKKAVILWQRLWSSKDFFSERMLKEAAGQTSSTFASEVFYYIAGYVLGEAVKQKGQGLPLQASLLLKQPLFALGVCDSLWGGDVKDPEATEINKKRFFLLMRFDTEFNDLISQNLLFAGSCSKEKEQACIAYLKGDFQAAWHYYQNMNVQNPSDPESRSKAWLVNELLIKQGHFQCYPLKPGVSTWLKKMF